MQQVIKIKLPTTKKERIKHIIQCLQETYKKQKKYKTFKSFCKEYVNLKNRKQLKINKVK